MRSRSNLSRAAALAVLLLYQLGHWGHEPTYAKETETTRDQTWEQVLALHAQLQMREALSLAEQLVTWESQETPPTLQLARAWHWVARIQVSLGNQAAAEQAYAEELRLRTELQGAKHTEVCRSKLALDAFRTYVDLSDVQRSEYQQASEQVDLARDLATRGQWEAALAAITAAHEVLQNLLGESALDLRIYEYQISDYLLHQGDLPGATQALESLLAQLRATLAADDWWISECEMRLEFYTRLEPLDPAQRTAILQGEKLHEQAHREMAGGEVREARNLFEQSLRLREPVLGANGPTLLDTLTALGNLEHAHKLADARVRLKNLP